MVRVADVREFPGHIACDGDSRSEIVVPVLDTGGEVSRSVGCGAVGVVCAGLMRAGCRGYRC